MNDLFSSSPPHSGPPTSRDAAEAIKLSAASLRKKVYDRIVECGDHGATDFELQHHLRLSGDTERPRRWELQKSGMITKTNMTRRSPAGRQCAVYVVAYATP